MAFHDLEKRKKSLFGVTDDSDVGLGLKGQLPVDPCDLLFNRIQFTVVKSI
jgi:hypothetical protein